MSALTLRLPNSLHDYVKEVAEADGVSVNQFISIAVAEKVSAMRTYNLIEERAKRSSKEAFEKAMIQVPEGDILEGDELPEGYEIHLGDEK